MALVAQPLAGRLGDRRGRRLLVVAGSLTMAIAIAWYAATETLATLIALRVVTGVGEALVFVGTGTIVADLAVRVGGVPSGHTVKLAPTSPCP
jgi:MFS family permease